MLSHPLQELEHSKNILIAGAGGGFDIYTGIPLYLQLQAQHKNVFLANYSFTRLKETDSTEIY